MAEEHSEEIPVEDEQVAPSAPAVGDVEMAEGGNEETGANANNTDLHFAEGSEDVPPRISFMTYLTSPLVTLIVGSGDNETILTAHQGLLARSPYFAEACAAFSDDGSVGFFFLISSHARLASFDSKLT